MKTKLVLLVSVMTLAVGLMSLVHESPGVSTGFAGTAAAQECQDKVLILLQGIGSEWEGREQTWSNVVDRVGSSYSQIRHFSYRDGDDDWYEDQDTYQSIYFSREVLHKLIAAEIARCSGVRIDLVGHSLGGVIAFEYVKTYLYWNLQGTDEARHLRHVVTLDSPVNGTRWDTAVQIANRFGMPDMPASTAAYNLAVLHEDPQTRSHNVAVAKDAERNGVLIRTFSNNYDVFVPPADASVGWRVTPDPGYTITFWLKRDEDACRGFPWPGLPPPWGPQWGKCLGHDQILRESLALDFLEAALSTTPPAQPTPVPDPSPVACSKSASFTGVENFPDGSTVSPAQTLVKTWRVRNTGTCTWGSGYSLVFDYGDLLGGASPSVPALAPGQEGDVSVTFTMPPSSGTYTSYWKMVDPSGVKFGDILWLQVRVAGQAPPASDAATFVTQSLYPTVGAGESFQIFFTVRNTGQSTWTLGSYWLTNINGTTLGAAATQGLGGNVYPGQQVTWTIPMTAPSQPGTYRTQWMISHNGAIFGPNMFIDVTVGGGPPNASPDRPQLLAPYDWYVTIGTLPELRWQKGGDPNGDPVNECYVRVEGATTWLSGWIAAESATPSGLGYWNYAWKVKCRDNRGAESDWSDTWHFSVASPDVTINDVHFDPASPSTADSVKIFACTDGRAGLGITLRVSVNDASDGSPNGEWHIIKELGVPCFNDIDAPVWYTGTYEDGVHRVRVEAFPQDPNIWTGGDTRDEFYTLQRRKPPAPQQLGPATPENSGVWLNGTTVDFRWNESIRASDYRLIVSTSSDPKSDPSPLVDVVLPAGSTSYTADMGSDYSQLYWLIEARNELGASDSKSWFGIDRVLPTSAVQPLTSPSPDTTVFVQWAGADNSSGVRAYDVQVRDGTRGEWADWLANTSSTFALFQGLAGHTYFFRSRAIDNAGNYESYVPGDGDTFTAIDLESGPPTPWWDAGYAFKRNLVILNNDASGLASGYPVHFHFDSGTTPTASELYAASQAATKGDDVRVVYNDAANLTRFIATFTPSAVDIFFRTQAAIPPATPETAAYQLYYGNAGATSPPGGINDVFYPPADANTVGLWHFQEGAGGTTADSSGNGNNGTIGSNASWTTDRLGNALSFKGQDIYGVVMPASPSMAVNAFTFEAWARRAGTDDGIFAFQGEGGMARERWLFALQGGQGKAEVWAAGGSSQVFTGSQLLPDTNWHHIALTFDGNRTIRFYLDGGLVREATLPVAGISTGSSMFHLAVSGTTATWLTLDGARLSNIVRTSFPYAQYAATILEPTLSAGEERGRPEPGGSPDLIIHSVATFPTETGDLLLQAVVSNLGDGDSTNGFYIDLYDGHQPSGPGDLEGSVRFWVASPVAVGGDVVVTTTISPPAPPGMGPLALSSAGEETTRTLYVQADSAGSVQEPDDENNISPAAVACFASADAFEADADFSAATPIAVGGPAQTHNTDIPGDEDWVSFAADAGTTYSIATSNLGPNADTFLYLYGTDGATLLASNDDSAGTLASEIQWRAPAWGTYFVKVAHWNPNVNGCGTSYDLLVSESSAPPAVGGIAELPDLASTPLETRASSGTGAGLLAGIGGAVALGAVALIACAWYVRRRWLRHRA